MAKQTFTTGSVLTATQMNNLQANDYNWTVSQKTASYVLVAADAGTRIEMNTASNTTVTVNAGLFTAGDTLFIQNIGSGSCVITAGTATVQKSANASLTLAQYQGGYLYFISASNAVFFADAGFTSPLTTKGDLFTWDTGNARLAVGTNGQVLTADSTAATGLKWGSSSSTKTFSLLNTGGTALTGAQTVTYNISGTYDELLILISAASSASASSQIGVRLNGDTNGYYVMGSRLNLNSTYAPSIASPESYINAAYIHLGYISTNVASTLSGYVRVSGCATTGSKPYVCGGGATTGGGDQQDGIFTFGGISDTTTAVSSVSVYSSSGNLDAGTLYVFGAA